MFEEAQLYSPVTTGASGEVTVHLHDGHPGARTQTTAAGATRSQLLRCGGAPASARRRSTTGPTSGAEVAIRGRAGAVELGEVRGRVSAA